MMARLISTSIPMNLEVNLGSRRCQERPGSLSWFGLYTPKQAFLDKTWILSRIDKTSQMRTLSGAIASALEHLRSRPFFGYCCLLPPEPIVAQVLRPAPRSQYPLVVVRRLQVLVSQGFQHPANPQVKMTIQDERRCALSTKSRSGTKTYLQHNPLT